MTIKLIDTRKWYQHISFFSFKSPKITVYLPKTDYTSLIIKGDTGDVSVDKSFKFDAADLELDTGDVYFNGSTSASLKIDTDTGDLTLSGTHTGIVEIETDTGAVDIEALCDGAKLEIEVSTGEVEISNLTCSSLLIESSSGDVELESVIASEKIQIETNTGDVELIDCDAYDIMIGTDTGDVEGTLLSDKHFIVSSKTGKKNYPKETTSEQKCRITTDTGDVKISIK